MLRNIGGRIVIDFPTAETKASRDRLGAAVRETLNVIEGVGSLSFAKSGLCSFTAPHRAQSLLERFTEPAPAEPVAGRRFTLDWQAKAALRRLEKRLRAAPTAQVHVVVGAALGRYFNARPIWTDRLRDRYGARFFLATSESMGERDYDLSE